MTIRLHAPGGSEEYCYACGTYWTGTHSCPEIQNMFDDGFDGFGEVLFVERTLEEPAAPEPSVEQMIEAMGDVRVFRVPSGWSATEPGSHKYHYGDTPREAVAALYRVWRERE